jgi:SAM-dependent methyltransferase
MTRLRWFWQRIVTSLTYRGVPFTVMYSFMYAVGLASKKWFIHYRAGHFDRRYGVATAAIIYPSALGLAASDAEECIEYEPCVPEILAGALQMLLIPFQDYGFVDLGCGKGLALLSASIFPFRRMVGIEWSEYVAKIARDNLARFSHPGQVCHRIEVLDGDATAYELPHEPLVIFLYNPFKGPLVRRFADNLRRSLEQCPRHVMIVYYNPMFREAFDEADFLREIEVPGNRAPVVTYESIVGSA